MSGTDNFFIPTNDQWTENSVQDGIVIPTGGRIQRFAAAGALNIGDLVYLSATGGVVDKSATTANRFKLLGIVVGGTKTNGEATGDASAIGQPAAATSADYVLVCVSGICRAVSDAAITAGVRLTLGTTTAGRVKTATITTSTVDGDNGGILGTALETVGAAGAALLVDIARM